jgi:hypothetical protein
MMLLIMYVTQLQNYILNVIKYNKKDYPNFIQIFDLFIAPK